MTSSTENTLTTGNPGEKPGGTYEERTETKATITAIDKTRGTVTLTGQDGVTVNITPLIPENLDKVKVGDLVVFTHTQEIAAVGGTAQEVSVATGSSSASRLVGGRRSAFWCAHTTHRR